MKKAFVTITFLAAVLSCRHQPEAKLRGADIILLNIETLRTDVVGAYGSTLGWTPNLDRIAAKGVLVEKSYTVASWTRPSVASLFTGLYPARTRAVLQGERGEAGLPESATTVAELLSTTGYRKLRLAAAAGPSQNTPCANMTETASPGQITVEGGERMTLNEQVELEKDRCEICGVGGPAA